MQLKKKEKNNFLMQTSKRYAKLRRKLKKLNAKNLVGKIHKLKVLIVLHTIMI